MARRFLAGFDTDARESLRDGRAALVRSEHSLAGLHHRLDGALEFVVCVHCIRPGEEEEHQRTPAFDGVTTDRPKVSEGSGVMQRARPTDPPRRLPRCRVPRGELALRRCRHRLDAYAALPERRARAWRFTSSAFQVSLGRCRPLANVLPSARAWLRGADLLAIKRSASRTTSLADVYMPDATLARTICLTGIGFDTKLLKSI